MDGVLLLPFGLHAVLVFVDEWMHRKRGLQAWESWGHPIDVLSVVAALAVTAFLPYTRQNLVIFSCLAVVSCMCITKDEFVHAKLCTPIEHWVHAVLFVLHPITLAVVALVWPLKDGRPTLLDGELLFPDLWRWFPVAYLGLASVIFAYQLLYWNFIVERGGVDR